MSAATRSAVASETVPDASAPQVAEELAARHRHVRGGRRQASHTRRRIRQVQKRLRGLFVRLEALARDESTLSASAQELLENLHVVDAALLQIGEDLPPGYLRRLPCVEAAPSAAHRVDEIAASALAAAGGEVDVQHLHRFVRAYQRRSLLSMGEVWALPSMLRLRLLEAVDEIGDALLEPSPEERNDVVRRGQVRRYVRGLRRLAVSDWHEFFEGVSAVERLLRRDPAGVYASMDFVSRDRYRKVVEGLAQGEGMREEAAARQALTLSRSQPRESRQRHIGYFLVGAGLVELAGSLEFRPWSRRNRRSRWVRRHGTGVLLGTIWTLTGLLLLAALGYGASAGGSPGQLLLLTLIAAIPAATLASTITAWALTSILVPLRLPRLDFRRGIPRPHRTLVVFPCMLTSLDEIESLLHGLEVNMLANREANLHFALLSDFADASEATMEGDRELLEAAVRGVEALNQQYRDGRAGPFHLLHRRRQWNPCQRCFMGWERKRGKLEELNRLLLGDGETTFEEVIGDAELLRQVRYVITLDADTLLPRGAARQLVGTMAHPLNRAELDASGRVVAGYTVLQPRIEITPRSANRSLFARIFSGSVGLDLYTHAVSDLYQDLVGEGIYAGKGIYEVAGFHRSLAGKVPENALLSHDLFEGLQGRAGLVSDVVVLEDHPSHVLTYLGRFHRWVRGDWQLLPWLMPRVPTADGKKVANPLTGLGRWKILDNLRRSLVPPTLLGFLLTCWALLPGTAWMWTAIAVGTLAVTLPLETFSQSRRLLHGEPWRTALSQGAVAVGMSAARVTIELALLPAQAALVVDAVGRTLYRLGVSRRRLLEWTTAAGAARRLGARPRAIVAWRRMLMAPILAVAAAGVTVIVAGGLPAVAVPLLVLWLLSPQLAHAMSRPRRRRRGALTAGQLRELRLVARRTWHFFEAYVGPQDHWLPPDNFQEEPGGRVARRTSPTNIGFYLLSLQVAYELGYVGVESFAARLRSTLDTLALLGRYRGHFWNWYSTESLAALEPRYVSTVDSGNLAACFVAVAEGIEAARLRIELPRPQVLVGLADLVGLLAGAVAQLPPPTPRQRNGIESRLADLEDRLRGDVGDAPLRLELLEEMLQQTLPDLEAAVVQQVDELAAAAPSAALLAEIRTWFDLLAQTVGEIVETARGLTPRRAAGLDSELEQAASTLRQLAWAMDFRFLFDRRRKLFYLGYDVSSGQPDSNHYDLLASEARLASFVAVAKGDAPVEHWLHLGRPFSRIAGERALLSWGGTAFEHLLPDLLLDTPEGTTQAVSSRAVVRRQIAYGRQYRVPWGISESGFASLSSTGWYQYRAFGVPGTGLRRGLGDRMVVAPYASMLALAIEPRAVVENLRQLTALGLVGRCGLYEAADFGATAGGLRQRPALVRSYMSHHQGMILAALAGPLTGASPAHWFHSDPLVATADVLLHEEVRFAPLTHTWVTEEHLPRTGRAALPTWTSRDAEGRPQVQVLGNGRLRVLLTDSGAGGSQWHGVTLTPWQPDPTREAHGTWVYVRDEESGAVWSVGRQPTAARPESYHVRFSPHKVEIHRSDRGILTHLTAWVVAQEDLEVRLLRFSNESGRPRRLSITSAAEPQLAAAGEAERHPAFARLFVETELVPDLGALVARRRPRSAGEEPVYVGQAVIPEPAQEWEADRAAFLSRDGDARRPRGLAAALSGSVGTTLDPVLALRRTVELAAGEEVELALLTAVGSSRQAVVDALYNHRSPTRLALALEEAETQAQEDLAAAALPPRDTPLAQELLSAVLLPTAPLRAAPAVLAAEHAGRPGLWGHGLSGDLPILLVRADREADLGLLRTLLRIHAFWRRRKVAVDLVVLDEGGDSYSWPLRERLDRDLARTGAVEWLHRSGGVYLLRAGQLAARDRSLLLAAASVVLNAGGELGPQLAPLYRVPARLPEFVPVPPGVLRRQETPALERPGDLRLDNGLGGFTADGREYVIHLEPGMTTPGPWINVVANPRFGFLVSESGGMCTWALDSSENRLTPWANDPIADPPGEVLYLRDEETGEVWSPSRQPAGSDAVCQVRHGAGYTVLRRASHGLDQSLELFVPREDPVKIGRLSLTNLWQRPRRITATWYAEWVLGGRRAESALHIVPQLAPGRGALLAHNPFHQRYARRTAFLATDRAPHGFTADRAEFLGRGGVERPDGLRRIGLARTVQSGGDPCAALQIHLDIPAGGTVEAHFLLGQGEDRADALRLIDRYRDPQAVEAARQEVGEYWDRLLGTVQVHTPEPEVDLLANRWLLYQALACRLWGRAGLYQSSGAFGFRDQLQDVCALLTAAPELARTHILEAARRQFAAGDVLHWWHPGTTRGLRSRCSDDLVWLPWATAQYVEATGDRSILDETVPYLAGPELKGPAERLPEAAATGPQAEREVERYDDYPVSEETATMYQHCLRALERASTRGRRGLPLIGSSDWNDGFDRVGRDGRGESVWLGFFLSSVLDAFAPLCAVAGDAERAERLSHRAAEYRAALEEDSWDGAWYTRAFYDDGSPLGSAGAGEAEIDLVAQEWAVLSPGADPARAAQAMDAVWERLADQDQRLMPLLAPPFDRTPRDPGYIKAYPPGVRENGGQYNHAAVWAAWAMARLGRGEEAMELQRWINPLYRTATREAAEHYFLEPYAVAGDICTAAEHAGRGGWSWYTGAAGWLHRLIVEAILGLKIRAGRLQIDHCLPPDWPGFEASLRVGESLYRIRVRNEPGAGKRVPTVRVDGEPVARPDIQLEVDGKEHLVEVTLHASHRSTVLYDRSR